MDKLWVKILCPIWSFFLNIVFWIFHFYKIPEVVKFKFSIANTDDIKNIMEKFTWTADKFKDWQPWFITLIARHFHDDCDGAAVMARHLFKKIGINGRILALRGDNCGHAVFVSDDRKYLTSNSNVYCRSVDYFQDKIILDFFGEKYKNIIK